jgi:hypothetical protein
MDFAGRLAACAHGFPPCRGKMAEGGFGQDGAAGIAGAKKQYFHGFELTIDEK